MIPLSKVYVDDDIKQTVLEVLDSGWFILGEKVREFERKFASFCGVKHAVCTSSGTTALFLSLLALDIGKGDEVIVPSFSFIATVSPVLHVGAKPVFADVNLRTYTLTASEVKQKLSKQTKAIIPVHLFGHPTDMDAILELADKNNLVIVEDACQAHGAEYKGRRSGSLGDVACFSFYPSKNMTVCGDGGIVTTDNNEIADKVRLLRDHGRREKHVHEIVGYNMRLNEIQAAIGIKQLEKLPQWNDVRRKIAETYNEALQDLALTPVEEPWAKHVYYMYVLRTQKRNRLRAFLKKHNVSTGIHYPLPLHKQPALAQPIYLENSEVAAETVLSLPMHPQLTVNEIEYVCSKIREFQNENC